jgi:hypothetical protein
VAEHLLNQHFLLPQAQTTQSQLVLVVQVSQLITLSVALVQTPFLAQ